MKKTKKKCYKCGETKSSKFSPSVKNMCRDCNNEYQKRKREEKKLDVIQKSKFFDELSVKLIGTKRTQTPDPMPVNTVEDSGGTWQNFPPLPPLKDSREETFISKLKKERDELEDRIIKIDILIDTYSK